MGRASSEAKNRWNAKNYDRIGVMVPKGHKAKIAAHAAARGESVNGFIGRAITETMERDGGGTDSPDNAPVSPSDGVSGGGGVRAQDATETPSEVAQSGAEGG